MRMRETVFRGFVDCVLAGAGAGLLTGALEAVGEAYWVTGYLPGITEFSAFTWGPIVYGIVFACIGACGAGVFVCIYFLSGRLFRPDGAGRMPASHFVFGLSFGAMAMLAASMSTALWCFNRNALGHPPGLGEILVFLFGAGVFACVLALLGGAIAFSFPRRRVPPMLTVVFLFVAIVAGSSIYGMVNTPSHSGRGFPAGHSGKGFPAGPHKVVFAPEAKSSGSNIILLVADTLRADYLSFYNPGAKAKTPCLEDLAHDAVLFQHCYAQSSWTKPSIASMFSARYPESHTATTRLASLPDEVVTIAEILSANGYFTKGFANNGNIMSVFNFGQGFTDYVDLKPTSIGRYLFFWAGNSASKLVLYGGLCRVRDLFLDKISDVIVTDFYQPGPTVTRRALGWLDSEERPKDAPFFLFVHWMDTHDPYMDHSKPGKGYAAIRLGNPDPDIYLEAMRNAYIGEIEYLDTHLGAFIEGLRKRGLYDDSVILFTSDHGEEFYDHGGWWHGKTLYDDQIRIPFLLKLPKNEKAGVVNVDLAREIDFAPTLLQFAGAKPDPAMSGTSLFAEDGTFANAGIGYVYSENDLDNNVLQCTRTREAKVILANPDNPRGLAPLACYDLGQDPLEQHNLADDGTACNPDLEKLTRDMMAFTRGNAAEPRVEKTLSDELKEQLRRLGYLGH